MNVHSDTTGAGPQSHDSTVPTNGTMEKGVAGDLRGLNFFDIDRSLQSVLELYCPEDLRKHMWPHWQRLGALSGGHLDDLAMTSDRHPPKLHQRDRFGRDEPWIEHHPAYEEMERIALGDFGLHAMSHMPGVLGWAGTVPPIAKYAFTYLFVQAEFGLMCPVSLTDTGLAMMRRFGDRHIQDRFVSRIMTTDMSRVFRAAQFMTEKPAGSDVGQVETTARDCGDHWELSGEKWFCSNPHADVALLLARPEGAPSGTRGLGMFVMPKHLEDGSRNHYRIVRLKDKLGTRSMASGEIVMDGAVAYALGDVNNGLKQMMQQVNLSRLSHGVRASAMMRRCLNEALVATRSRFAFGQAVADMPLAQRQILKLMVPTEQSLSMYAYVAQLLGAAQQEDEQAAVRLRLATGLFKFRACRDNPVVATGSMELRGGNGYIEDFIGPRLIRDAQIGLLWEGTSNINGLDILNRAVARVGAHRALQKELGQRLSGSNALPPTMKERAGTALDRATDLADDAARRGDETMSRSVSSTLYHATTAALMAWEGATLGARGGDARRLLLARMVLDHRLSARDPLAPEENAFDLIAGPALVSEEPIALDTANDMLDVTA